jgi:phosphoenolpyruvate carboxykinase (GTP)
MAMRPFCGYNFGDYLRHWLDTGHRSKKVPKIFHVNWFRQRPDGSYIWPGFGENLRVLRWIVERCEDEAGARESPVGLLPSDGALDLNGVDLPPAAIDDLFRISKADWAEDLRDQSEFFRSLGDRLPAEIWDEHTAAKKRLGIDD